MRHPTQPAGLQYHCLSSAGRALPALWVETCAAGFERQMDAAARRSRWACPIVLGSFLLLCLLTLLNSIQHQPTFMLESFVGMIAWITLFYGMSGRLHWRRIRSARLLQAGRENAWQAMMRALRLSGMRRMELSLTIAISEIIGRLAQLQANLRLRLGVIDLNLTRFRLIPPVSAHA
jgi:hypothetical protein